MQFMNNDILGDRTRSWLILLNTKENRDLPCSGSSTEGVASTLTVFLTLPGLSGAGVTSEPPK